MLKWCPYAVACLPVVKDLQKEIHQYGMNPYDSVGYYTLHLLQKFKKSAEEKMAPYFIVCLHAVAS